MTDDCFVDNSRFDVFDEDDDDGTDLDRESFVESVPDGAASIESHTDGVSILAEIEIGAGQTRDFLTAPSMDEFRDVQAKDSECNRIGSSLHGNVIPTEKSSRGLNIFLRRVVDSVEQWSFVNGILVLSQDDGTSAQLIYVSPSMIERVIQYFHEGPMAAH